MSKEKWETELEEILINNDVWIWVRWKHSHDDYYKHDSIPEECYYNKKDAYDDAMKKNIEYLKKYKEEEYDEKVYNELIRIESSEEQLNFLEKNFYKLYGLPQFTNYPYYPYYPYYIIWRVVEVPIAI